MVDVEIPAGYIGLVGVLRLPAGPGPWPGLVLTRPFTGVKEQVVGTYAAALAAAGFATLAFDHRNFGESGGAVRQHEDSAGKLEDLRQATSFLAARDGVDATALGCVGICLGGGYALRHSAFDPRIRAVAMVAAAFNDPRAMRNNIGADGYRQAMAGFAAVEAAMPGAEPFAYYGTPRSASPGWINRVTRLSIRELLTFDAAVGADFLGPTPALIVHGRRDDFCSPQAAAAIHARLTGPKDLIWLDTTNHIDLYDQPQFVDPTVQHITTWMNKHLSSGPPCAIPTSPEKYLNVTGVTAHPRVLFTPQLHQSRCGEVQTRKICRSDRSSATRIFARAPCAVSDVTISGKPTGQR